MTIVQYNLKIFKFNYVLSSNIVIDITLYIFKESTTSLKFLCTSYIAAIDTKILFILVFELPL